MGCCNPLRGYVRIGDWDTKEHSVAKLARRVGYVFQNPDEQLFSKNVGTEVAFGPRNLGFNGGAGRGSGKRRAGHDRVIG